MKVQQSPRTPSLSATRPPQQVDFQETRRNLWIEIIERSSAVLGAACEAISACEKGGEWLPVLQLLQQMLDESVERFHIPKPRGEQEKDMALKHYNMMTYHERFQTSPKTPETHIVLMILRCLSCESITLRIRQALGQEHSDLLCCDQRL